MSILSPIHSCMATPDTVSPMRKQKKTVEWRERLKKDPELRKLQNEILGKIYFAEQCLNEAARRRTLRVR